MGPSPKMFQNSKHWFLLFLNIASVNVLHWPWPKNHTHVWSILWCIYQGNIYTWGGRVTMYYKYICMYWMHVVVGIDVMNARSCGYRCDTCTLLYISYITVSWVYLNIVKSFMAVNCLGLCMVGSLPGLTRYQEPTSKTDQSSLFSADWSRQHVWDSCTAEYCGEARDSCNFHRFSSTCHVLSLNLVGSW